MQYFDMKPAEEINIDIQALPKAELCSLKAETSNGEKKVPNNKALLVTDSNGHSEFVYMPTNRYHIVQHEQAFRPIIEGLVQAGAQDFKYILYSSMKEAHMQLYMNDPVHDGVNIGFNVTNSFDGRKALMYGFSTFEKSSTIELVGYRQICSNGMKIKVSLNQAEFVRPEIRSKIKELFEKQARILHTQRAFSQIAVMQYVAEAMVLLQEPVKAMIQKAQNLEIDQKWYEELIKKHVGKRFAKRITEQYREQTDCGSDLWGLYNAITYVASHENDIEVTMRETLLNKASNLLFIELNDAK